MRERWFAACRVRRHGCRQHLATFLSRTRTADRQLPSHVERELRAYLECGILAYGFMRVRCEQCGQSRAVAFSCKRRGFCLGCLGRRMADTAARLADEVIPCVPVRQWVLSLPFEIRYRLAWDGELVSAVLAVFLRVVEGWYRRQARHGGQADSRCGAVTLVQRFGSALNLNPHFHVLALDGKLIAALTEPSSIRRYLHGMGLPARAPPIAPARPEPQTEFDYA